MHMTYRMAAKGLKAIIQLNKLKEALWRQKAGRDAHRISIGVRRKSLVDTSNRIKADMFLRVGVQLPEEGGTTPQRP